MVQTMLHVGQAAQACGALLYNLPAGRAGERVLMGGLPWHRWIDWTCACSSC
jgi:hypothetical protein